MSTELFELSLDKITKSLDFVSSNKNSDFYKKHFGESFELKNIKSYEDFRKLPFLTKDALLSTPLYERTFVPKEEISFFTMTSGTTNQNMPLTIPLKMVNFMSVDNSVRMIDTDFIKTTGMKNFMLLFPSMAAPAIAGFVNDYNGITPILGDITKLPFSALMAKLVELDAIITSPTILLMFTETLRGVGFDFSRIKYINLMGEVASAEKVNLIQSIYPNAYIDMLYGAAECANGVKCYGDRFGCLKGEAPNIFHLSKEQYFIEVLDDNDEPVEMGQPGNLVITDLYQPKALPFIRYKIGDYGKIYKKECDCGNNYVLELMGRTTFDLLKVHGALLHSQEIEEALRGVSMYLEPGFQMHVYEEKSGEKIVAKLELHLIMKKDNLTKQGLGLMIRDEVESNLKMSADKTLKDLVNLGTFLPLKLTFIEKVPLVEGDFKLKKIISHLQ